MFCRSREPEQQSKLEWNLLPARWSQGFVGQLICAASAGCCSLCAAENLQTQMKDIFGFGIFTISIRKHSDTQTNFHPNSLDNFVIAKNNQLITGIWLFFGILPDKRKFSTRINTIEQFWNTNKTHYDICFDCHIKFSEIVLKHIEITIICHCHYSENSENYGKLWKIENSP